MAVLMPLSYLRWFCLGVEHQEWPRDLTPERVEELVAGFGSYEKMFERI